MINILGCVLLNSLLFHGCVVAAVLACKIDLFVLILGRIILLCDAAMGVAVVILDGMVEIDRIECVTDLFKAFITLMVGEGQEGMKW